MIALAVFTDGRDGCLAETLASAETNLHGPITRRVIFDDTGDTGHRVMLEDGHPGYEVVGHDSRLGFGGSIESAWQLLASGSERFVFHLEDDFTFNRSIQLADLAFVLDCFPHLAQLALRRQPWNDEERAAGGIVEQHPDDYKERIVRFDQPSRSAQWLEHRRFFTTNPSLYHRNLCERGWPTGAHSEGVFTHELLADPDLRFGYWGSRDSGEWVRHIGVERAGVGY